MTELKPCPCCGGKAELSKGYAAENVWQHGEFHRVYCGVCQLRQLFHRTPESAASAWNRRAASPADQVEDARWIPCAVSWLRGKAAEQAQINEKYPDHVACYPSWTEKVKFLEKFADELEGEATIAAMSASKEGA